MLLHRRMQFGASWRWRHVSCGAARAAARRLAHHSGEASILLSPGINTWPLASMTLSASCIATGSSDVWPTHSMTLPQMNTAASAISPRLSSCVNNWSMLRISSVDVGGGRGTPARGRLLSMVVIIYTLCFQGDACFSNMLKRLSIEDSLLAVKERSPQLQRGGCTGGWARCTRGWASSTIARSRRPDHAMNVFDSSLLT